MVIVTELEMRIKNMDLKQAYNFLTSEDNIPEDIYKIARWGYLIPRIDIYDFLNGSLILKRKRGEILHRGRKFNIEQVYTDMEKRLITIKRYLIAQYGGEQSIVRAR